MTRNEFKANKSQYENEPVMFFFSVCDVEDRNEAYSLNRSEMAEKCLFAIPLSELSTDWNDTDDDTHYIPNVGEFWCAVSMPEVSYVSYVVFGTEGVREYYDEGKVDADFVVKRQFRTKAERDAYYKGIDDGDGWDEYATLTEEEYNEIVK